MSEIREGGCLCGAIRYRVRGKPQRVTVCHCTFCQRRTGGALSIHVWFDEKDITLLGNEPATYEQRSDESNYYLRLHFCSRCATTVMLTLENVRAFGLLRVERWTIRKASKLTFMFGAARLSRGCIFQAMRRRSREPLLPEPPLRHADPYTPRGDLISDQGNSRHKRSNLAIDALAIDAIEVTSDVGP